MKSNYNSVSNNIGLEDAEIDGKCDGDDLCKFELQKLESTMYNEGLRIGTAELDNNVLQGSFDDGFQQSYSKNLEIGRFIGQANGVFVVLERRLLASTSEIEIATLNNALHDISTWISTVFSDIQHQMDHCESLQQFDQISVHQIEQSWEKIKLNHEIICVIVN